MSVQLVAILLATRAALHPRLDPTARRPWRYVTAHLVLLTVYGVCSALWAQHGNERADLLFVGAVAARVVQVPVLLVGLLSFTPRSSGRGFRWKIVFDLLTVVGGGVMILWYFVLGPTLTGPRMGSGPAQAGAVLFTIGDLTLILGVTTVLLRGSTDAARRSVRLLLSGAALFLVTDIILATTLAQGSSLLIDAPWFQLLLSVPVFLTTAAAAERCRQASAERPGRHPRPLRARTWLPSAALALGYALLGYAAVRSGLFPWTGLVLGAAMMTGGVAGRHLAEVREKHELALTDALTGLASRVRLRERLVHTVERGRRPDRWMAVLLLDLDGFKQINDRHGHEAGDTVLTTFADVLRGCIRRSDTAARLGGDEFAVVLDDVAGVEEAIAVARRVLAGLEAPRVLAGVSVTIRTSIGVAVAPAEQLGDEPGAEADELMRRADTAMYIAKRKRSHSWQLYSAEAVATDRDATELRADLLAAAGADQFRIVYQPIVGLAAGGMVGVEALVRWDHPARGQIAPSEFIPLAEETGAIHDIGIWVLRNACLQVRQWQRLLPEGRTLSLSVNVSARQLDREDLADQVLGVLDATGFDSKHLIVEVTESTIVDDRSAIPQLQRLREHGIRVALDDFGTGYSSLRYLTRLPIDILKLDRCFVAELNGQPEGSVIAEAVIRLAQVLRLDTVAEGVEEPAQAAELAMLGFGNAQGFHFARPLSATGIEALIEVATLPLTGGTGRAGSPRGTGDTGRAGGPRGADARPARA